MKPAAVVLFALALAAQAVAQEKGPDAKAQAKALVDQAKGKHGKDAIDLYTQAISKDPLSVDAFTGRGAELRHTDPLLALADFAHAEAASSNDFPSAAYFWRAVTLLDCLLDRTAAWDELERLKRRGQGAWAYMGSGLQRMMIGRWDDAIADFEKVAKNDASIPLVFRFKAICHYEAPDVFGAAAVATALEKAPEDPTVQATKALLDGASDWDAASKKLDALAGEFPKVAWIHVVKSKVFQKNKKWEDSLAPLDAADLAAPCGAETAYLRGRAQFELGKMTEAETALTNAITWDTQMGDALGLRAEVRMKNRDWYGAVRDYEAMQKFALTEQEQGALRMKIEEATKRIQRDAAPLGTVAGLCERAEGYIREGDFERAAKDIEDAAKIDANDRRPKITWLVYWAKKKDVAKLFEAVQAACDAELPGFAIVSDARSQSGIETYAEIQKDPKFNELRDKLTLKTQFDFNARGIHRSMQAIAMQAGPLEEQKRLWHLAIEDFQEILTRWGDGDDAAASALYNMACCYSLANELDKAFEHLDKSIDRGFDQVEHMEKNDTDLANMRKDPRFAEAVKKIKAKTGKDK